MSKSCIICGKRSYSDFCFQHKPRKRIKQQGKQAQKWKDKRAEYLEKQPDTLKCYLCGKILTKKTVTLDHVIPRSRRPDLRYNDDNLKLCCWFCNTKKGSKVY